MNRVSIELYNRKLTERKRKKSDLILKHSSQHTIVKNPVEYVKGVTPRLKSDVHYVQKLYANACIYYIMGNTQRKFMKFFV